MVKRVAITGPESTGKSWLAKKLAMHYHTVWVDEYAREYLKKNGADYCYEDIVKIARRQKQKEQQLLSKANKLIFCDTEPMVTKIWSEVVFGTVDKWIEQEIIANPYDLYLLCYPDLPWEPDPLRENPDNRTALFELYQQEFSSRGYNFRVVKGTGKERFNNALLFVNALMEDIRGANPDKRLT